MNRTSEPLLRALNRLRSQILDPDQLVKAVASGRQRGTDPAWRRAELRYVDIKAGRHLQITTYDATQAFTANHAVGDPGSNASGSASAVSNASRSASAVSIASGSASAAALDALLDVPFANWTVTTTSEETRVQAKTPTTALVESRELVSSGPVTAHDQPKERLLPESDEVFRVLGLTDGEGRLKPSRQAKFRQVEEFLRQLDAALTDATKAGRLRRPTADDPLRIIDLGCGNGYLTFAAQRYLTEVRELPVVVTGVDVKEQSREHNTKVAAELGMRAEFVVGTIDGVVPDERPDVVLALHACDTATDDALARAVEWEAPLVLAAPCCHHDIAAQLRKAPTPSPYGMLTRHGILRERFADTLTDALRASLMRLSGYRVEVVQFVESRHTPRNTMLRAVRTGGPVKGGSVRREYDDLVTAWAVEPRLAELIGIATG